MSTAESLFRSQLATELASEIERKLTKANELSLISQYRKAGIDPEVLRFCLNQARFKQRARAKFGNQVDHMLFTEPGLEQSTRGEVANWHASQFQKNGLSSVTDLGAGIGADSIAFATSGLSVTSLENHPDSFEALQHNLSRFSNATALEISAEDHEVLTDAIWLDPARRDQDRKSLTPQRLEPAMFSPNLTWVFELAQKFPAGIKLAPAFPHELIPAGFEANWVSHNGDLVELTLWSNPIGEPGIKKAVMVATEVLEFAGKDTAGSLAELGNYIYEPDVSLIRSHLIGDFSNQNDLALISEGIAYLTSEHEMRSPWLKGYRVLDVLPLDEKTIRGYCHKNNFGILEIKKRGVDITPEQLRPKLKLKGSASATLILTKVGSSRQAIVCEPIR